MKKEIKLSFAEIAELLKIDRTNIVRRAQKENWLYSLVNVNGGESKSFPLNSLPQEIQDAHFRIEHEKQRLIHKEMAERYPILKPRENQAQHEAAWDNYAKMAQSYKDRANARAEVLRFVDKNTGMRRSKTKAIELARKEFEGRITFCKPQYFVWQKRVQGVPQHLWAAYLLDQPKGPQTRREDKLSEAAWEFVSSAYLTSSKPTVAAVYRLAKQSGFVVPTLRALQMRMNEDLDTREVMLEREGPDVLAAMYPPIVRTVDHLHAYQLLNIDGHLLDVMMTWEDGTVSRPLLLGLQCIFSRSALVWRLCKSENKHDVLAILGACFRLWGLPEHIYMDNGRSFASKWISGGGKAPFRGMQLASDPLGLLPVLGIEQTYVLPHHGQSKPIERMWRTFCAEAVAKSPECVGAYLGNSPENAPFNRGEKTVTEAVLRKVIAREFENYNNEEGRQGGVAHGRSYGAVFAESYATQPIRKPTAAQLQLCLLPAEKIRADSRCGMVSIFGNSYWHESLNEHMGKDLIVRFNPDDLQAPVYVYDAQQVLICEAECTLKAGFNDIEAARKHAKAKAEFVKAAKQLARAESRLNPGEIAAMLPQPAPSNAPKAQVIKLTRPAIETREPLKDQQDNVLEMMFAKEEARRRRVASLDF